MPDPSSTIKNMLFAIDFIILNLLFMCKSIKVKVLFRGFQLETCLIEVQNHSIKGIMYY